MISAQIQATFDDPQDPSGRYDIEYDAVLGGNRFRYGDRTGTHNMNTGVRCELLYDVCSCAVLIDDARCGDRRERTQGRLATDMTLRLFCMRDRHYLLATASIRPSPQQQGSFQSP